MIEQIASLMRAAGEARTAGRTAEARNGYDKAAGLAREAREHMLLAHALRHVSELDRESGEPAAAWNAGSEAVALYRADPQASRLDLANALRVPVSARGN